MAYDKKKKEDASVEHHDHHGQDGHGHTEEHFREKHLMLDPLPRGKMNEMVMESMYHTTWKFWALAIILAVVVAVCLFYEWYILILEGQGVAGVMRPDYWG